MFRLIILATICLSWHIKSSAQDWEPIQISFGVEDGLPSMFITDLFQSDDGLLWIATSHGVCTFDGRTFRRIPNDNLIAELIIDIDQAPDGKVWCMSSDKRLYYYDVEWQPHPLNDSLSYPNGKFRLAPRMAFDDRGVMLNSQFGAFIATENGFEIVWESDTALDGHLIQIKDKLFGRVETTSDDDLPRRILLQRGNNQTQIVGLPPNAGRGPVTYTVAMNEHCAYGRATEAAFFNHNRQRIYRTESIITNCLFIARDSTLWVGTESDGVFAYSISSDKPKAHLFRGLKISAGLQDNSGGYWFGTEKRGLIYVPSPEYSRIMIPPQFGDEFELFASNSDVGIYGSLGRTSKLRTLDKAHELGWQNPDRVAFSISTSDSVLMSRYTDLNGNQFLSIFNTRTHEIKKRPFWHNPQIIVANKDSLVFSHDRIYFGFEQSSENHFIGSRTHDVKVLNDSTYLVATTMGAFLYTIVNQAIKRTDTLIFSTPISYIIKHTSGILIFPQRQSPLLYDTSTKQLEVVSQLPIVNPVCHTELNGKLILGTGSGVYMIDHDQSRNEWSLINVTKSLGLPVCSIRDLLIHNGTFFYSTIGYVAALPLNAVLNCKPSISRISISRVQINNLSANITDYLSIKEGTHLVLGVQLIDFRLRNEAIYSYRFYPFDTNWTQTSDESISFFSLKEGNYILQISGGGDPIEIKIEVQRPFYANLWFIAICLTFIIMLLIAPLIVHLKFKVKEHKLMLERDSLKLQGLTNQLKPHFIFNALTSIQSFVLKNNVLESSEYLFKFAQYFRNALTYSKGEYIELVNALDSINTYLELEKLRLNHSFDFSINVDQRIDLFKTRLPVMLLQPYVENAVIHAMSNIEYQGEISIKVSMISPNSIQCRITDNGPGFSNQGSLNKSTPSLGVGTSINNERINLINRLQKKVYNVHVSEREDSNGLIVTIDIPLHNEE